MITIYVFSVLTIQEGKLLDRLLSATKLLPYQVKSLTSEGHRLLPGPAIIIGSKTSRLLTQAREEKIDAPVVTIHSLLDLVAIPENEENRKATFLKLTELKKSLEAGSISLPQREISTSQLPVPSSFSAYRDLVLQLLSTEGEKRIVTTSKDGTTICIRISGEPDKTARVNLTAMELLLVQAATELLKVERVQIIDGRETNSNSNNSVSRESNTSGSN